MLEDGTHQALRSLLAGLKGGDGRIPLAKLVDLSDRTDAELQIDRSADPTVVFVAPSPSPRLRALSPRELEVAELMAGGLSNREIGSRLYISVATVKDHVHAVLAKTSCTSRTEVAALWHGSARP